MLTDATVHATGINWGSIIFIIASIVTTMSIITGLFAKLIGNQITRSIDKFRIEVIQKLDARITVLEAQLGRRR